MRKEIKAPLRPEHLRIHAHTRTQVQHVPHTPHTTPSSSSSFPCCGLAFDVQLPKGDRQQQSKQSQNQRRLHAFSSPIPLLHPSPSLPSSFPFSSSLCLRPESFARHFTLAAAVKILKCFSHAFSINSSFFFFIAFSHFLFCSPFALFVIVLLLFAPFAFVGVVLSLSAWHRLL